MRVLETWLGRGPWPYLTAGLAGVAWLFASGIPTGIIETPFYVRMTPVEWWNYPFWIVHSVLVGTLAATYVPGRDPGPTGVNSPDGRGFAGSMGGGLLTVFAIGCPVCNKLVVLALGFGGAMTYFAPVQPFLGFLSTGLLLYGLRLRLSGARSCPVGGPTGSPDGTPVAERDESRSGASTG